MFVVADDTGADEEWKRLRINAFGDHVVDARDV
jgi:hypothetical protein